MKVFLCCQNKPKFTFHLAKDERPFWDWADIIDVLE